MAANNPDTYTPDMIEAVIAALEGSAVRLKAVHSAMTRGGVEKLPIRNSKEMKARGLPKITAFAQAAEDAMRDHQLGG